MSFGSVLGTSPAALVTDLSALPGDQPSGRDEVLPKRPGAAVIPIPPPLQPGLPGECPRPSGAPCWEMQPGSEPPVASPQLCPRPPPLPWGPACREHAPRTVQKGYPPACCCCPVPVLVGLGPASDYSAFFSPPELSSTHTYLTSTHQASCLVS